MTDIAELADEQKYFDEAWTAREAMRENLGQARGAAANKGAAVHVGRAAKGYADQLGGPNDSVAYGRFDLDDERFYVGKHGIFDRHRDLLVIDWRSSVGALYEQATVDDPRGVLFKRAFRTQRNTIESFDDLLFADLVGRIAELTELERHGVDDVLLDDLDQSRTGAMRDIVKTIQAAQSGLIRFPLDTLLVIQGGPGTGKSAVALHRVSWIIYNHPEILSAEDVLVVGPTDTFTNYIRQVLPALGDTDVTQRSLRRLGPQPSDRREEAFDVAALKGSERMAGLLRRALHNRIRFSGDDTSLAVQRGASGTSVPRASVEARLDELRAATSYNQGRASMRTWLTRQAELAQLDRNPRASVDVDSQAVDSALERVWPQLTAQQFLQDLLGSTARIREAAGDHFTARDIDRLYRQAAPRLAAETWSDSDVALLDESEQLIRGTSEQFAHIVVDEAQDLSPMQLKSIHRRSRTGSYTIVGDIAQSTGPAARTTWDDVVEGLVRDAPVAREELEFGYRVPAEVMEIAARLLPVIAPELTSPTIVRNAPEPPTFHRTTSDALLDDVVTAVERHAGKGRFVGVIAAPSEHHDVAAALRSAGVNFADADSGQLGASVNLMSAAEAKGLEFDAVVVVEPAAIADLESGLRLLFIALTRATKYLTVVQTRECAAIERSAAQPPDTAMETDDVEPDDGQSPSALTDGPRSPARTATPSRPTHDGGLSPMLRGAAQSLAEQIRAGVSPAQWEAVLDEVRAQLTQSDD